jgi:hypothetical protein
MAPLQEGANQPLRLRRGRCHANRRRAGIAPLPRSGIRIRSPIVMDAHEPAREAQRGRQSGKEPMGQRSVSGSQRSRGAKVQERRLRAYWMATVGVPCWRRFWAHSRVFRSATRRTPTSDSFLELEVCPTTLMSEWRVAKRFRTQFQGWKCVRPEHCSSSRIADSQLDLWFGR